MDLIDQTNTQLIENLGAHLAVFPDWNLNDAEVQCRFTANTSERATCELDVFMRGEWRRPTLAGAAPPEYCLTIRFSGVRNVLLSNCDPPHVAGELAITALPPEASRGALRRVTYHPIAGLSFELECEAVSVVAVVPIHRKPGA